MGIGNARQVLQYGRGKAAGSDHHGHGIARQTKDRLAVATDGAEHRMTRSNGQFSEKDFSARGGDEHWARSRVGPWRLRR